jgi:hypothetical protein
MQVVFIFISIYMPTCASISFPHLLPYHNHYSIALYTPSLVVSITNLHLRAGLHLPQLRLAIYAYQRPFPIQSSHLIHSISYFACLGYHELVTFRHSFLAAPLQSHFLPLITSAGGQIALPCSSCLSVYMPRGIFTPTLIFSVYFLFLTYLLCQTCGRYLYVMNHG